MKPNGRNYKMFRYTVHEYMNARPEVCFATYRSQDEAIANLKEYAKYISGSVSEPVEVSPMEYFEARQSRYWRGLEGNLDIAAEDCSEEWLDEYSFYVEHKDINITALKREWNSMFLYENGEKVAFVGPQNW